jgi:hypothetical protein
VYAFATRNSLEGGAVFFGTLAVVIAVMAGRFERIEKE